MKEIKDVIAFILEQNNPWVVAMVLAAFSVPMFKLLREISSLSFATQEKKLATLLSCVDAGIENKHRFSVEQVFRQYYGRWLTFDEISYLLAFDYPAIAIYDYVRGAPYIAFDPVQRSITLKKKKMNLKIREWALGFLFFVSLLAMYGALMTILILVTNKGSTSAIANSVLFLILTVVGIGFSIAFIPEISAATRMLELATARQSKETLRTIADNPSPAHPQTSNEESIEEDVTG